MDIQLVRAFLEDADKIWKMQVESFMSLYEKYQDTDTSPATEPLEKVIWRLDQPNTYFYFILPEHRNKGYAQKAIIEAEKIHGDKNWSLDTILQGKGNCALYEKMGYVSTGRTEEINDKLILVHYEK